jgi:hypothetical protein
MNPETGGITTEKEARLYPRGRFIRCTPDAILVDSPNPSWAGGFPIIRFTLDPLPWSILGASMVIDLLPMQNALNEALRGAEDGIGQWVRRGVVADRNAISKNELNAIDSRKSGLKALLNPAAGEGFKLIDGPELPEWYMKMLDFYIQQMDENSGVRGLQQLSQMKQMPAADTVEQFMDALSPLLRLRGRQLEVSLSELAEMLKIGFFQHYTMERRVQTLGGDGKTLEDFDFDPGTLVPAPRPGDAYESRQKRAATHHKNFSFSVAPNSFLNVSHATQKLLMLQLYRIGGIDIFTLWEALDIPNIGHIPVETIPERLAYARKMGLQEGPTPEMVQAQQAAALVQAQAAIMQVTQQLGISPPPPGQGTAPGLGPEGKIYQSGTGPQGGRPPSGQEMPQIVSKDGGTRQVISESGR